jgi:hypothetical protein
MQRCLYLRDEKKLKHNILKVSIALPVSKANAEKFTWFQNQIDEIILVWKETPQAADESELVLTNKLLEDLKVRL